VALLLIVSLWGSFAPTAKLALRDFQPFFLVTLRCFIGAAFLVALLRRSGQAGELSPPALRAFLVLAIAGIVVSTQLTYVAIYYTTAANAIVIQCATPIVVTLGAHVYLGERLGPLQWAGAALSALGVLVVVTNGRLAALRVEELRPGDFITLCALTGWAAYTVYGKRVLGAHTPLLATTGAYVLGTLMLVPIAAVSMPLYPPPDLTSVRAWSIVLYQALLGAVAHIWWYRAVSVVGASGAAVFMNLQPVVGLALAWLLLREEIGLGQVVGTVLVLAGVAATTRTPGPSPARR
jgi:drug/metabolite transporter (DMT)-like permease